MQSLLPSPFLTPNRNRTNKSLGFANGWRANGFDLHGPVKRNHKEESLDIGAEACYVKHCGSVRPAFVLEAHRENELVDLMYIYVPMGLERESALQGSILARFRSHELASCFLKVSNEELGMGYLPQACTVAIPTNASKHGTQEHIVQAWKDLITLRALRRCYAIDRNQITPSEVIEWTSVRATVMPIAGSELAVELEDLDVVMKEIDASREGMDAF